MPANPTVHARAGQDDPEAPEPGVRDHPDAVEQALDARLSQGLDRITAFRDLQAEVRRLADQLHQLEHRLGQQPQGKTSE